MTGPVAHAKLRVRQIREARKNRGGDKEELRKEVFKLALPATGEQLLSMMVGLVDAMLVGHLGASALAAVSLANQWVYVIFTLSGAVSTGSTVLVARSVGGKDWDTANRTLRQSVLLGFCIGLAVTVLGLLFAEPAMALMGAEPDVLAQGVTYLRIVSSALVPTVVLVVGNACLRGAGDTRTAMKVMAVVNVLNVVVAWVAINGPFGLPKLGVAGSALGAFVGRSVGGLLVVGILLKGRSGLKLELRHLRPDFGIIRRVLRVGLPSGGEQLMMSLGMLAFLRVIASLGTVAVAAHVVALRIQSLSFMPGFGFSMAGTTLVGQGLGARDPRRAERSGYLTYQMAASLMAVMGLVFILFPQQLTRLFTDDLMVVQMAVTPLRMVGFTQPFLAATMVFAGNLRGAGDTRFPMYVTAAGVWIIRVSVASLLTLALGMGLSGAWLSMSMDQVVRGTIFFLRFRGGRWKKMEV